MLRTSRVFDTQREFAQINGYGNEIIWDLLSSSQSYILKDKIKKLYLDNSSNLNEKNLEELHSNLFQKVWDQRKYTNHNSLTSIFYVLVTDEKTHGNALASQQYSCHPVFRTRKCVAEDDSTKCCMIFIDETGRVYQNWRDYVDNNVLPKGIMVAPKNGYYTFDENNKVNLDIITTPAARVSRKVLEFINELAFAFTLAATGASFLHVLTSVGQVTPMMSKAGQAATGYRGLRAGSSLFDRYKHDESISLTDRHARSKWLEVVGGAVSIAEPIVTSSLTTAAEAGKEVSKTTMFVANAINISSTVLSGCEFANSILDLILKCEDGEKIGAMDIGELAVSLLLFTHSIANFQLASKIVADIEDGKNSYSETILNRQRRILYTMHKETNRIKGPTRSRIDVIRIFNEIPDVSWLNLPIEINNHILFMQKKESLFERILERIEASNNGYVDAGFIFRNPGDSNDSVESLRVAKVQLARGAVVSFKEFERKVFQHIHNLNSFKDIIMSMAEKFHEDIFRFMLDLTQKFISTELRSIQNLLRIPVATEAILFRIFSHCLKAYKDFDYTFLSRKSVEIIKIVKNEFLQFNPNYSGNRIKCPNCPGYYSICSI